MKKHMCAIAGVIAAAGVTSAAHAGTSAWDIVINWGSGSSWSVASHPENYTIEEVPGANGATAYHVTGSHATSSWSANWDMVLDPDPFVSSSFSITNVSGVLQTFTITTITPAMALAGPTSMTGSISGSVGDGNGFIDQFGNGATVRTSVGLPFYEALVDNVGVRSLYSDPQLFAAPVGLTAGVPAQNFIGEAGPGIAASIGIRNNFELTPGDNAQFTSTFLIVPSPAGLALFGAMGLAAARRRR